MLTQSDFKVMLRSDLARRKLTQKEFANEFVYRGEQMSAVSISHWIKAGYIPSARLAMALDILGPDSRLARVPMDTWEETWIAAKKKEKPDEATPVHFMREPVVITEGERIEAQRRMVPSAVAEVRRFAQEEYKAAFNPPMEDRDQRHIPSYSYGGIVAQIVRMRPGSYSLSALTNAIFKLAVIKSIHGHEAIRAHVILVVKAAVHPSVAQRKEDRYQSEELRSELLAQYRYDANMLGVQVVEAEDAKHAAKLLKDWATGTVGDELDEDGVEEIDMDEDF